LGAGDGGGAEDGDGREGRPLDALVLSLVARGYSEDEIFHRARRGWPYRGWSLRELREHGESADRADAGERASLLNDVSLAAGAGANGGELAQALRARVERLRAVSRGEADPTDLTDPESLGDDWMGGDPRVPEDADGGR
jgi:hypothetical protein